MMTDQIFTMSHLFRADRQRVWDAWAEPERLERWFGPKGSKMTIISGDILPGGRLHSHMDFADGGRIWALFVYREVNAPTRLVWEHSFSNEAGEICASPFGGPWPNVLLNTAEFIEDQSGTLVRLTSSPLDATAAEAAEFRGAMPSMSGGWGGSFEVLDDVLAR